MGEKLKLKEVFKRLEASSKGQKRPRILLTQEEERVLIKTFQEGRKEENREKAKYWLILCNQGLVIKISRAYFASLPLGCGIELDDLIQGGNVGLTYTLKKFDLKKGAKLSTYAAGWIRQTIHFTLRKNHQIIIGERFLWKREKVRAAVRRLSEKNKQEPTIKEIEALTGLKPEEIKEILDLPTIISITSLYAPIRPGEDDELLDFIEGESLNPLKEASFQEMRQKVAEALSSLSSREREVIEQRFGIGGQDEQTLEEVGEKINRTRERVRQIEERAINKLQKRLKALGLDGWLGGE